MKLVYFTFFPLYYLLDCFRMNEQGAGGVSKHVLFNPALTLDTPDAHGLFSPG